ncbi:hypothetical protein EDD22DRAFT_1000362 [Suillus occidentalis]|nr:hypothetical protein EDD22DRAFT_1000362 [Suillus occidentalis]
MVPVVYRYGASSLSLWSGVSTSGHSYCEGCLKGWFDETLTQHIRAHPTYDVNSKLIPPNFPQVLQGIGPYLSYPIQTQLQAVCNSSRRRQPEYTCPGGRQKITTKPSVNFVVRDMLSLVGSALGQPHTGKESSGPLKGDLVVTAEAKALYLRPATGPELPPLSPVETPDRLQHLLNPGFCNPKVGRAPSSSAPSPTTHSPARTSECAGSGVWRQSRQKMLSAVNLSSKTPSSLVVQVTERHVSDHAILFVKVLDPFPRAVLNSCAIGQEACAVSMGVGEILDNCIPPEMWDKTRQP